MEWGRGKANPRQRATVALAGAVGLCIFAALGWIVVWPRLSARNDGRPDRAIAAGRVIKVLDGDTIVVAGIGTVRYLGIDTPELHHPRKPVQRFAARARRANRQLVEGVRVRLVTDAETRDAYGRLLAYVYRGGVMVNKELVRQGLARAFPFAPNLRHAAVFEVLERRARERHLGLWGTREGGPPTGTLARLRSGR